MPYRITVYTSDVRGAGTDGDVYLRMKGPKGATGETQLESARNNFERNQIDVFEIKSSEVGPVEEITVRLVSEGGGGRLMWARKGRRGGGVFDGEAMERLGGVQHLHKIRLLKVA